MSDGFLTDFEAAELESKSLEALDRVLAAERAAVREAVAGWAEQAQVTPERWLEVYAPDVERRFEGTELHITVRPVLRGDVDRMPVTMMRVALAGDWHPYEAAP